MSKSQLENPVDDGCFVVGFVLFVFFFLLPHVLLYMEVTGIFCQEKPIRTPHICRLGHGSDVCSLLVCAGGPLPGKVLQVLLRTKNLK